MSTRAARYADGTPVLEVDADAIARAFGFASARHLDDVLAGRAPTAFGRRSTPTT